MSYDNNPLEEKKAIKRKKSSSNSQASVTGYMEAGNEQKFKRRG